MIPLAIGGNVTHVFGADLPKIPPGEAVVSRISTKDRNGDPNGYLVPLWSALERDWRPDQVYLTAVYPHTKKGPHLHKVRHGRFVCVKGNVTVIRRYADGSYDTRWSGEDHCYYPVEVPPGVAAQICNNGDETALVLNFVTPAWSAENPDDWPVEDWL